jgi:cobalt-zinc-cadmium resistance protein CzcA
MTESLVAWSVRHRQLVVGAVAALAAVGAFVALRLDLDALPDITTNQVLVLTRAPGLTPEEVERFITRPIETALGGVPGALEQRSLSRYGISSVTTIFDDDVDPFRARQIVQERIAHLAQGFPAGAEAPELGPLSGGLGEIFHFTLSSPRRTSAELLEFAQFRAAPLLRSVAGVVEVNTWGGERRTLEIQADPLRLAQRGLTLDVLRRGLEATTGTSSGASLAAGPGQVLLRAVAWPRSPEELGLAVVAPADARSGRPPVRLSDVAEVGWGSAPRIGAATSNGRGETVYVMAQMLLGANALDVMDRVHARLPELRRALPEDVRLDVVYDRSVLVGHTLRTVAKNLGEGGLLVILVLFAMLGSLRAGLLVAAAIPLSMLGALAGMVALGIPGNLMSLGAIDFGLLVDGAVVMVENVFHKLGETEKSNDSKTFHVRIREATTAVARPVFFSVLIIVLVYVPILTLRGVDGKMFRPMALTVVLALATSLLLSLTFIPAAAALFLRPRDVPAREPLLVRAIQRLYTPTLLGATRHPRLVALGAALLLALGVGLYLRAGTSFAPQLDEGDLVVQTTRAPDISLESSVREALRLEREALKLPEVVQIVSRVGSPAVATDIMGLEQADVFVELQPRAQWRPGLTREALIDELNALLPPAAAGDEPSFTQPIQMRFNELLGGAVTDVAVSVYGEDLAALQSVADALADTLREVPGAEDVRVLAPPSVSLLEVRPRPLDASHFGFTSREILDTVQAVRTGLEVGTTWDGPVRIPMVLRLAAGRDAFTLRSLPMPLPDGSLVALERVADVNLVPSAGLISRHEAQRRLVVGFNVRGADLGTVVEHARRLVEARPPPAGIRLAWGGQYEQLEEAARRLSVVIPLVLLLIVAVLVIAFRRLRSALILFAHVPFACVGGIVALSARDLPLSVSAAIGFIALSGIAVLNGVVLMTRLLSNEHAGESPLDAARHAALARARPVLMTALVAALGFVPMMLATGIGSEVQRPLATVVVGGLVTSTLLTLVILPTLYPWLAGRKPGPAT